MRPRRRRVERPEIDRSAVRYMIYRLHDDAGNVVYVGRSCNVAQRLRAHYRRLISQYISEDERPVWLQDARRVTMRGPYTWDEACRVERQEIETHQPRGNRMHTRAHGWKPLAEGGGKVIEPDPRNAAYGRALAASMPPLTDEQVEQAARIFARLPQQRTP